MRRWRELKAAWRKHPEPEPIITPYQGEPHSVRIVGVQTAQQLTEGDGETEQTEKRSSGTFDSEEPQVRIIRRYTDDLHEPFTIKMGNGETWTYTPPNYEPEKDE